MIHQESDDGPALNYTPVFVTVLKFDPDKPELVIAALTKCKLSEVAATGQPDVFSANANVPNANFTMADEWRIEHDLKAANPQWDFFVRQNQTTHSIHCL